MALNNQEAYIIPRNTVVPAGTTEAGAVTGNGVVGPFADYAATFAFRIENTAALGAGVTIVFYGVDDSGDFYEFDRFTGDIGASYKYNGVVPTLPGFSKFAARAFGNGTNSTQVTVVLKRQAA